MPSTTRAILIATLSVLALAATAASARTEPTAPGPSAPIKGAGYSYPRDADSLYYGEKVAKNAKNAAATVAQVARARGLGAVDVVFVGDQSMAGLESDAAFAKHAESIAPGRVAVLAVSGDGAGNIVWRLDRPGAFPVAKVYVVGATNANDPGMSPEEVAGAYAQDVTGYIRKRAPDARIVVLSPWATGGKKRAAKIDASAKVFFPIYADSRMRYVSWPLELGSWNAVLEPLFPLIKSMTK